jgi:hypothetical protein
VRIPSHEPAGNWATPKVTRYSSTQLPALSQHANLECQRTMEPPLIAQPLDVPQNASWLGFMSPTSTAHWPRSSTRETDAEAPSAPRQSSRRRNAVVIPNVNWRQR